MILVASSETISRHRKSLENFDSQLANQKRYRRRTRRESEEQLLFKRIKIVTTVTSIKAMDTKKMTKADAATVWKLAQVHYNWPLSVAR